MTEENYAYRTSPMFLRNQFKGSGRFNIPVIPKSEFSDDELNNVLLIGFDRIKNDDKNLDRIVHFFLYDYKFENIWNKPDDFVEKLKKYKGDLSPDFSMYLEMNPILQLYNTFRNRWCGVYLASKGIRVIPTVNWGDENTFDFCFEGIPKESIVAVSTYMVQEHNNHSDQKEFFLNGYHEMIKRIEPTKILCYSEPFPEMEGDIIFVDYELSGWKYQKKIWNNLSRKNTHDIMIYKTTIQPNYFFDGVSKGSGSAYGGKWKPQKPGDDRYLGKPGEIKVTYDEHGMKRWTKIGMDGRAVKERHFGDHRRSDKHTVPHDHIIQWDPNRGNPLPQGPINYPDGAPEFKHYHGDGYKMSKFTEIKEVPTFEDNRFKTISEFKWCVNDGGEVEFEWKGNQYTICHPDGRINIGAGCYEKDGKYYNMNTNQEYTPEDEMWGDTADDILEYNVGGDKLRDVITQVKVWSRSI